MPRDWILPNITTADIGGPTYSQDVLDSVDLVLVNVYPFWESYNVVDAVAYQKRAFDEMKSRCNGKWTILGEIGWPTAGEQIGAAIPSVENLGRFMREWKVVAIRHDIQYFWFEFSDEV
ncbi:hypothetical protein HDU76_004976 [Blyttiomyces sp. JEL0837]|nr:hypothetical protein HDU76_004976 [Blyttiomyces sp. JEL0837]